MMDEKSELILGCFLLGFAALLFGLPICTFFGISWILVLAHDKVNVSWAVGLWFISGFLSLACISAVGKLKDNTK